MQIKAKIIGADNDLDEENIEALFNAYRIKTCLPLPRDIKNYRLRLGGISQEVAGLLLDISTKTVSRYENGDLLSEKTSKKFLDLQND